MHPLSAPTTPTHKRHSSDSLAHQESPGKKKKSRTPRHVYTLSMDSSSVPVFSLLPLPPPSQQSPPSRSEVVHYYRGLPSYPKLVARTGTKWEPGESDMDFWGYRRFLAPVGDHAIVQHWKEGQPLPQAIMEVLTSYPWIGIDILRVAEWKAFDRVPSVETTPVVMLITVEPGNNQWHAAIQVARRCRDGLYQFGITDVEVEIKESAHIRPASSGAADTPDLGDSNTTPRLYSGDFSVFQRSEGDGLLHSRLVKPLRHLSDTIGTRFTPDHRFGTKGLYLNVAPTKPAVWSFKSCSAVLTCRHVVFRTNRDHGEAYRWDGQPATRIPVNQNTGDDDIARQIRNTITDANKSRANFDIHQAKYPNNEKPQIRQQLELDARNAEVTSKIAKVAEHILAQTNPETDMSICVGHVLFAQKYCVADSTTLNPLSPPLIEPYSGGCWVRDYALVEMSDNVHGRDPTNRLPISCGGLQVELQGDFAAYLSLDFWQRSTGENAVLSSEIVPDSETMNFKDDQRIVGKVGAKTGLTFGIVNEVKSVTRSLELKEKSQKSEAWEICVINPVTASTRSEGRTQTVFSATSDSGAAVWDLDGRVLGILGGGLGQSEEDGGRADTTYVTSIDRIIQDLATSGITATLP